MISMTEANRFAKQSTRTTWHCHSLPISLNFAPDYQQSRAQTSEKEARWAIKHTSNISLE